MKRVVKCPRCNQEVEVDISREIVEQASSSPAGVTAVVVPHGDHQIIVYVDKNGGIRGVEAAVRPTVSLINTLREVPVPAELTPDVSALTKEELRVLVMCDGKRSLREIAELLGMPFSRVRLIAERLRALGYLKEIELRM